MSDPQPWGVPLLAAGLGAGVGLVGAFLTYRSANRSTSLTLDQKRDEVFLEGLLKELSDTRAQIDRADQRIERNEQRIDALGSENRQLQDALITARHEQQQAAIRAAAFAARVAELEGERSAMKMRAEAAEAALKALQKHRKGEEHANPDNGPGPA